MHERPPVYVPPSFAETDLTKLQDAIEQYSFAVLTSAGGGELTASHLPLLLDRFPPPNGTLLGHMARANHHWRTAANQPSLAVFSGPHAYISPRWYEAERVVPTWNYVAVHVYGTLELIDDPVEILALLHRTVEHYESSLPEPWRLEDPPQFLEQLAQQIVAFRIPIDRIEGKWKLNQNHSPDRREKVIAALTKRPDAQSQAIAELMSE